MARALPVPPRPGPLFAGTAPKEARILEAALDLFVERGFHATTVPDVARRARVAAGTIYLYFPSKEDLVNALIARLKGDLAERVVASVPGDAPIPIQFDLLWDAFSRWFLEHPRAFTFLDLHFHAPYATEAAHRAWEPAETLLLDHYRAGRRAGVYRDLAPAVLRAIVAGVFLGAAKFARAGELELTHALLTRLRRCAWAAISRTEDLR